MRATQRLLSSAAKLDLKGIFPPIATPFNSAGDISFEKLADNFSIWKTKGFRGYVVMGSNGEFPYLSEKEKLDLVKACKQNAGQGELLITGAGCEGTHATIEMCQKMADEGADAVLVHTPCFYKGLMTADAIKKHYVQVADASPLPVVLYNVPSNTGIDMTLETVLDLCDHSNIIGIKDSSGNLDKLNKMAKATTSVLKDFQILAGSAGFLLPALRMGCVGGVVAAGNLLGTECVQLCDLHSTNQQKEADALQEKLIAPNLAITRKFGVPALKHMMDKLGYYGGPVRSPLLPLSQKDAQDVEAAFKKSHLL